MARTFVITGSKSLTRMLNALGSAKARELHRKAVRKAIRPVLTAAKAYAPVKSGALRDSLTIRATRRSRKGIGVMVTNKVGNTFQGKQFYGGFQEYGWRLGKRGPRKRKSEEGDTRRKIPGKWFMRKAGVEQEANVITIYEEELDQLIKSEASK